MARCIKSAVNDEHTHSIELAIEVSEVSQSHFIRFGLGWKSIDNEEREEI